MVISCPKELGTTEAVGPLPSIRETTTGVVLATHFNETPAAGRLALALFLSIVLLLSSARANAQEERSTGSPDVGLVLPAVWAGGPLLGPTGLPFRLFDVSLELSGLWVREAFVVQKAGEPVRLLQGEVLAGRLSAEVGLGRGFSLGIGYDYLGHQTGMRVDRDSPFVDTFGSGDLSGLVKWIVWSDYVSDTWSLSFGTAWMAGGHPGTTHTDYFGRNWFVNGALLASAWTEWLCLSFSSGFQYSDPEYFLDRRHAVVWDNRLTAYVMDGSPILPEVSVLIRISEPFGGRDQYVAGVLSGGARVPLGGDFYAGAAVGTGIGSAAGSPDVFALLSVGLDMSCVPDGPAACTSAGLVCGTVPDGCGGLVECGDCGNDGCCVEGQCKRKTTCSDSGRQCGTLSDGCGGSLHCGNCEADRCCNAQGRCVAAGATCSSLGRSCGTITDACGNYINCGECARDKACTPEGRCCGTCETFGFECGPVDNGCGALLHCGTCKGAMTCENHRCIQTSHIFKTAELPPGCILIKQTPFMEMVECDPAVLFGLGDYCPSDATSTTGSPQEFVAALRRSLPDDMSAYQWDLSVVGWSDEVDFGEQSRYRFNTCPGGKLFGEDGYRYLEDVHWVSVTDRHLLFGCLRAMTLLTLMGDDMILMLGGKPDYRGESREGSGDLQRSVRLRIMGSKKGVPIDDDELDSP